MKRSILLFLCLVLVLGIAGSVFAAGQPESTGKLKIAYIRPTNEPYYKYGFDGAEMIGQMMGVEILGYMSDQKADRELASIEDAITQQVDGIVLFSVSATGLVAGVNKAHEANIPIFMLFGHNEEVLDKMVGTVQVDCVVSGSIMGKWVAENISGGDVAIIMGLPGRGDAECYRDAFIAEAEKNSKIKVVSSIPGDWNRQKAFSQMQILITGYPDLKAVFVQNEDMALGAIKALEEAGKADQVAIVSQNGAPYGLESIAAGGIKATAAWSPAQEAQLAVRMLVEFIRDKKTPSKLTLTPMKIITKNNVNDAVPWEPTEASTKGTLELDLSKLLHEFPK